MNYRPTRCHHPRRVGRPGRGLRRGFSLIELLVVIGVILVLVGIAVIGFNAIQKSAAGNATKTAMGNGRLLVTEYEQVQKLSELDRLYDDKKVHPTVDSPGDVNEGTDDNNDGVFTRHDPDVPAIGKTHAVIRALSTVPANKASLERLGEKSLLKRASNTPASNPQMLADGWGNPIIFVPSGGMTGVRLEANPDASNLRVTSAGVVEPPTGNPPKYPPGLRPFWASPGPDGNFTTHDDNVYSFEG